MSTTADPRLVPLGQRLRAERVMRGEVLKQLVDRTGLSASTLSLVERGRVDRFSTYVIVAEALGLRFTLEPQPEEEETNK